MSIISDIFLSEDGFYVTWGASEGAVISPGQPLPPHGKQLGRLDSADLKQVIQKVDSEELMPDHYCLVGLTFCTCICFNIQ